MKASFGRLLAAPLAALVLASFALTPAAQAAGREGGGGGRGGGGGGARASAGGGGGAHAGARAGGGGGGRPAAQAHNARPDARANEVRSSSVNSVNNTNRNTNASRNTNINANQNVNVNRNVNVNASGNNNCCGGWDNDYHPVAGAMAVGAAVAVTSAVIGSMVPSVPSNCVPINYGGMVYQQCGSTWYQPQGSQFVVVNAPY